MAGMPGMPSGHHGNGSHPCHCMGVCCGAAPVAIIPQATQWLPAPDTTRMPLTILAAATLARLPQPAHSLPFATAPPSAPLV